MTTESPGWTSLIVPDTVFVTCDATEVVTLTVLPFASVTYSVEPLIAVTVPTVAPAPVNVAPPPPAAFRKRDASDAAFPFVVEVGLEPRCFCASAPPMNAPAPTRATLRTRVTRGSLRRRRSASASSSAATSSSSRSSAGSGRPESSVLIACSYS